jgi:hypothetical protein
MSAGSSRPQEGHQGPRRRPCPSGHAVRPGRAGGPVVLASRHPAGQVGSLAQQQAHDRSSVWIADASPLVQQVCRGIHLDPRAALGPVMGFSITRKRHNSLLGNADSRYWNSRDGATGTDGPPAGTTISRPSDPKDAPGSTSRVRVRHLRTLGRNSRQASNLFRNGNSRYGSSTRRGVRFRRTPLPYLRPWSALAASGQRLVCGSTA